MTDDKKLRTAQDAFQKKLRSITTWTDFKTMVSTITKTKVKNFLTAKLQDAEQGQTDAATNATNVATDISALIIEVNNI